MHHDPSLDPIFEAFRAEFAAIHARLDRLEARLPLHIPQFGRRADVSDWLGVSIQCVPYEGTPVPHGLDSKSHSYRPAEIFRQSSLTAAAMLQFLDPLPEGERRRNGPVFRDFVNTGQLTEAGEYTGRGRETWLREWIAHGGRILFVNAALHNESPDADTIAAGPDACLAYLRHTGPQGIETMRRIVRLIHRLSPEEQRAIVGVETMNEPAIYDKAGRGNWGLTIGPEAALAMFERDQADIARTAFREGLPDHVLVLMPRYKYSADADSLIAPGPDGTSILDRWRAEFGDRIGISTHKYAPWIAGKSTAEWQANLLADLAKIPAEVPQVVTETNSSDFASGGNAYHHAGWTLAEISAATGVPFQYFPGANWGAGALYSSRFTPDRTNEPDRMFVWYDLLARTLRPEPVDVTLPIDVVRSTADPRHGGDRILGLRVTRTDAPEIALSGPEAIMCYGGDGPQNVTMNPDEFSWFSGWHGNDTVDASRSPGCIINLGDGEDTIILGGQGVTVHGRGGGDTFVLSDHGTADIYGFDPAQDRIKANGVTYTIGDKIPTIRTAGGGIVRLHWSVGAAAVRAAAAAIIP